jgi:hypothetical protein
MARDNTARDEPWAGIVYCPNEVETCLATILTRENISPYARAVVHEIDKLSDFELSKTLVFYFAFEARLLRDSGKSAEEIKEEIIEKYKLNPRQQEKIFPKN